MKKIKVLIASVLAGSGHNSAADLLAEVLNKDERFEVIRYTNPTRAMDNVYNGLTKFTPFFHNLFVHHSPVFASDFMIMGSIGLVSESLKVLKQHEPDIVLATHFTIGHSFRVAEWLLNKYPLNVLTLLDYGEQTIAMIPYNIYLRPEYTVVYDEKSFKSVRELSKQNSKYIITGGHDCRSEFKKAHGLYEDKVVARKALKELYNEGFYQQLDSSKTTILLAGGGGGIIQKTFKLLKEIAERQKEDLSLLDKYQFLVICGQNQKYYDKLSRLRSSRLSWQNIFPFGWLDATRYALIQRASDYPVLFGIAPATMHELLETECGPLLIHRVRADHEFENVDFVSSKRLGRYQPDQEAVVKRIFTSVTSSSKEGFKKRAGELLQEEAERLAAFPDALYSMTTKKLQPMEVIYQVPWYQRLASVILIVITLVVYYYTKVLVWLTDLINKGKKKLQGLKARLLPQKNAAS